MTGIVFDPSYLDSGIHQYRWHIDHMEVVIFRQQLFRFWLGDGHWLRTRYRITGQNRNSVPVL